VKIIVTGACGFIGSNLVHHLNQRGERDIIAVDNLTQADKFKNIVDAQISDYIDKQVFLDRLERIELGVPKVIFHQGACSNTMETDGRYMMENNYRYTLRLLNWCQTHKVQLIYASSAAVYGLEEQFVEDVRFEKPLNVYGYSKFLFDQILRQHMSNNNKLQAPVTGLRYFNVYGPREQHKGRMASVAFHHVNQFLQDGKVRLFEGSHGYPNGSQKRDFIHIDDVVAGNLHFLDNPTTGIFNLGTGRAQSFNDVALTVVNTCRKHQNKPELKLEEAVAQGAIEYTPFPEALKGKYQAFTQANIDNLRATGFSRSCATVEEGTERYVSWLLKQR